MNIDGPSRATTCMIAGSRTAVGGNTAFYQQCIRPNLYPAATITTCITIRTPGTARTQSGWSRNVSINGIRRTLVTAAQASMRSTCAVGGASTAARKKPLGTGVIGMITTQAAPLVHINGAGRANLNCGSSNLEAGFPLGAGIIMSQ
ncbi:MAG: hypothetical protein BWY09_00685 [Candidatus Hydrogenedentes bacterium ADurb.Bin179]|nr:MAG: hypothetical protein BWY09_00685 [Candidatus Hydrogenedentes bacterium ADurb.Bin179]